MARQATLNLEPELLSEEDEHAAVMDWAIRHEHEYPDLDLLYHIPNGGSRSAVYLPGVGCKGHRISLEGRRLKRLGVKPGVPDLHLPVSRQGYHSLYIEMKRVRDYRVSEDQRAVIDRLRAKGNRVEICAGFEAAKRVLIDYLGA